MHRGPASSSITSEGNLKLYNKAAGRAGLPLVVSDDAGS